MPRALPRRHRPLRPAPPLPHRRGGQAQHARAAPDMEARCAVKIALFLGAGASVPYGMPTTKKLRDKIDHKSFPIDDILDSSQFPDIEHVISTLDQLNNFAQSKAGKLYAEFESRPKGADRMPKFERKVERAARASNGYSAGKFGSYVAKSRGAKEIIEQLITRYYKWDPSRDESAEKILRPLFDFAKSREGHVTIFTTNYDTVIEAYCGNPDRSIERIDGFKFHTAMRAVVWDGRFVPRDDNSGTKVFLYKLHGSMNWLADMAAGRQLILQKPDTSASDDRARDMYIRPSLDTKGEATQKEPYTTILREFNRLLPSFDACVVIGYSFRDPHISERLVEFARAGGALVVLSPTAAADFKSNALAGHPELREKAGRDGGMQRRTTLESGDKQWAVHIMNEHLAKSSMDDTIEKIRSAIGDGPPGNRAHADAGAGS